MARIRSIGLPENDSERKAINYLKDNLPDDYIVFTNLELPTSGGLPYEYDLIVIGEFAVYSIEVKGYRGEIKGNAYEWELESGAIYRSPIPLANKKAKIVGDRLQRYSSLLSNVWVQSLILLTDDQARVHINDPLNNSVVHLKKIKEYLLDSSQLQVSSSPITRYKAMIEQAIAGQFKPLRRANEIGDYRVLETISKNNLFTTLLSEHRFIPGKRFNLKVYSFNIYDRLDIQQKHREWILRDANALFHLAGHPNIVQAYPPFPWLDNQIVLPVEWIDGYSLRGILNDSNPISYAKKLEIIRQSAEGLEYAHRNKVVHRDLRPDNIIVCKSGSTKLVNFDCARVEADNMQTIATRIGRFLDERYVAPEVWDDPRKASPSSDLYALGIIFFEMLMGHPPYERLRDAFQTQGLPKFPTQSDPKLPLEVDELIKGMCAFYPQDRYQSLSEMLELLKIIE